MSRRSALGVAAVVAATAGLFVVSRGKWSDPLIDSGREWIVPDFLARGGLLYRDVVYWFGPFTPHFQAFFFRVFGSGFGSLVAAGAVAAAVTLGVLYAVLRRVSGGREATLWTALAIPALVFMPNAGGALLGMGYRIWHAAAFALAGVVLASSPAAARVRFLPFLAGAAAGLAGLCRTEWGLAAAAATGLACLVRARNRRRALRDAFAAAGAALTVFAVGLWACVWRAGPAAVFGDGHVLLTRLPDETRHFLVAFSGVRDWRLGVAELVYSAAMWSALFAVAGVAALPSAAGRAPAIRGLLALFAVLAASAALGGAGGAVLFSAAPLVAAAGLAAGLARRHGSAAAALSACGLLGLVLSYRRPFHIADSAYVAPPLLFAFAAAAGVLRLVVAVGRRRGAAKRLAPAFRLVVGALVVGAFAGRAWQYASLEGVPIAETSGMLTARRDLAREIEALAAAVRRRTPEGSGLVVFPEGELLNLLASRRNPIRHKLYLPGYLTAANESNVLRELEAARPSAVILWRRPVSEYDRAMFGEDYGIRIREWIEVHYDLVPFRAAGAPARANAVFVLGLRRP